MNKMRNEIAANMRVQLIQNPELKRLTRHAVEEFEILYADYVASVEAQGSKSTKPLRKALCTTRELRSIIAMKKGLRFSDVKEDMILKEIELAREKDLGGIRIDLERIFKGMRMVGPKHPNEITDRFMEYLEKINERAHEYGLNERFLNSNDMEIRRQCFPKILQGVWPQKAGKYLEKKWQRDGKTWTLSDLIYEMETTVTTLGPIELMASEDGYDRERRRSRSNHENQHGFKRRKTDGFKVQNVQRQRDYGDRMKKKTPTAKSDQEPTVTCYRCGTPGHIKPECRLSEQHPKVKEMQKKKGLKRLGGYCGNEDPVDHNSQDEGSPDDGSNSESDERYSITSSDQ